MVTTSKLSGTETERKTGSLTPGDLVLDLGHAHCHGLHCSPFSFLLRDTGHSVPAAQKATAQRSEVPPKPPQRQRRQRDSVTEGQGQGASGDWAVAGALAGSPPPPCPSTTTLAPQGHTCPSVGARPMPRARPTLEHRLLPPLEPWHWGTNTVLCDLVSSSLRRRCLRDWTRVRHTQVTRESPLFPFKGVSAGLTFGRPHTEVSPPRRGTEREAAARARPCCQSPQVTCGPHLALRSPVFFSGREPSDRSKRKTDTKQVVLFTLNNWLLTLGSAPQTMCITDPRHNIEGRPKPWWDVCAEQGR